MAIKTFSVNEVLTASDTNTFLANAGLVFVKAQTVGTAVPTVTVSSAFSSTYDNYLIQYNGGTLSAATDMTFYFGSTPPANGYTMAQNFVNVTSGVAGASTVQNQPQWTFVGGGDTNGCFIQMNVYNVNSTGHKYMTFQGWSATNFMTQGSGYFTGNTAQTAFTFDPNGSATMTGGTITVYGYRKA